MYTSENLTSSKVKGQFLRLLVFLLLRVIWVEINYECLDSGLCTADEAEDVVICVHTGIMHRSSGRGACCIHNIISDAEVWRACCEDWRKLHFICTNSCRVRSATPDCTETWPSADRDACGDPPVITRGNADLLQHHSLIKMISLTLKLFLHFLCYAQIQKRKINQGRKWFRPVSLIQLMLLCAGLRACSSIRMVCRTSTSVYCVVYLWCY